jgi:hypothetical protein
MLLRTGSDGADSGGGSHRGTFRLSSALWLALVLALLGLLACAPLPGVSAQNSNDTSWNITFSFDTTVPMAPLTIDSNTPSPYTVHVAPGPKRDWTDTSPVHWLSGITNGVAVGGTTVGLASPSTVPIGRQSSCSWTGKLDGELYLFGGFKSYKYYNDLWRFARASRQWILVRDNMMTGSFGTRRVESATNMPVGRLGHSCSVDDNGDVWMTGQANKNKDKESKQTKSNSGTT